MSNQDYYSLLGVDKSATKSQIKKAFRNKAKKYHPDINKDPGAEEEFKKYAAAYEILSDDTKRAKYDRLGHNNFTSQSQGGGFDFHDFDFGDIFGDFFGGFGGASHRGRSQPSKGQDVLMQMNVSFESAVYGDKVDIKIKAEVSCKKCSGTGAKSTKDIQTCSSCGGKGQVIRNQQTPFGTFAHQTVCSTCRGEGKSIKNHCNICQGYGFNNENQELKLTIPVGIQTGQHIKLAGKGKSLKNYSNGDLYIEINVLNHKHFKRDGNDIYCLIPLSFVDATLGTRIDVPTIHGNVNLKIPPGTQHETRMRLKNYGIRQTTHIKGNHYVIIDLKVPEKLTTKQKKALEDFKKAEKKNIFQTFKNWFN